MLTEQELEQTSVVANCCMNRERELRGSNGYTVELGLDPVEWLVRRSQPTWLDICCGTARALVQAAAELHPRGVEITGVDLVAHYWPTAATTPGLSLHTTPIREFVPERGYDLITCVHGLHYVGDKLGTLECLASWLLSDGVLLAHLDPEDVCFDGNPAPTMALEMLRQAGFTWDPQRGLLRKDGPDTRGLPVVFQGAVPGVPNRTGQPSAKSLYAHSSTKART